MVEAREVTIKRRKSISWLSEVGTKKSHDESACPSEGVGGRDVTKLLPESLRRPSLGHVDSPLAAATNLDRAIFQKIDVIRRSGVLMSPNAFHHFFQCLNVVDHMLTGTPLHEAERFQMLEFFGHGFAVSGDAIGDFSMGGRV